MQQYPDIREAVKAGQVVAWEHWRAQGELEGRQPSLQKNEGLHNDCAPLSFYLKYHSRGFVAEICSGIFEVSNKPNEDCIDPFALIGYRVQSRLHIQGLIEAALPIGFYIRYARLIPRLMVRELPGLLCLLVREGGSVHLNGSDITRFIGTCAPLDFANEVDGELYRDMHLDLAALSVAEAREHYHKIGRVELRRVRCPPLSALSAITTSEDLQLSRKYRFQSVFVNFPQFHKDSVNDRLWGDGWTDFVNIERLLQDESMCDTLIPRQSLVPAAGFYDYSDFHARQSQSSQVRAADSEAVLAWYYYYFDGLTALDAPLEAMMRDGHPEQRFFLIWANEGWSRRWDPDDDKTQMIAQTYDSSWWLPHAQRLARICSHAKYYRVNDRPVLGLCKPSALSSENGLRMREVFHREMRNAGLSGIYYLAYGGNLNAGEPPETASFVSAAASRQPDGAIARSGGISRHAQRAASAQCPKAAFLFGEDEFNEALYLAAHRDVEEAVRQKMIPSARWHWDNIHPEEKQQRRCMLRAYSYSDLQKVMALERSWNSGIEDTWWGNFAGFCNASRLLVHGRPPNNICTTVTDVTPYDIFKFGVRQREQIRREGTATVEHVLYNAWNEWGEGNCFEPCAAFGNEKIVAFTEAQKQFERNSSYLASLQDERAGPLILVVSHYGGGGTEKFIADFFPDALVLSPDPHDSAVISLHTQRKLYRIDISAPGDYETWAREYMNIFFLEELHNIGDIILRWSRRPLKLIVNHLLGHSPLLYHFIQKMRVPYCIPLHDYFFLSSDPQLDEEEFQAETFDPTVGKLASLKLSVLKGAKRIISPSRATKQIYERWCTDLVIDVRAWAGINKSGYSTIPVPKGRRILIYGEMTEKKGRAILKRLLAEEPKGFSYHVAGIHDISPCSHVSVSGRYEENDLRALLSSCDIVLFLSSFPETFCFAAVAAFSSSRAIIAPPYGAFLDHSQGRASTLLLHPRELLNGGLEIAFNKLAARVVSDAPIYRPPLFEASELM